MPVEVKAYTRYCEAEILALYRSVGWSAYYSQPERLWEAFERSLCVFGAWEDGALVGLIRVVGDGETVVFIQDILVNPAYQRRGIGTRLVAAVLERYRHVRQMHLMTDDLPETVGFYKAVGFTPVEKAHFRAFTRLK